MTEHDYRTAFQDLCTKYRRARLPGSKALCIERAYDVIDLYLAWRDIQSEGPQGD